LLAISSNRSKFSVIPPVRTVFSGALFIYVIGAGYYLWKWTRKFEERHTKEVNDRADGLFEHFGGEKEGKVITEKDINDLYFGIEQNVDYIAMSFVGCAKDIIELRDLINSKGGKQNIIAKIERKVAFENIDEILKKKNKDKSIYGYINNIFKSNFISFQIQLEDLQYHHSLRFPVDNVHNRRDVMLLRLLQKET
jgi:hypothetical protein